LRCEKMRTFLVYEGCQSIAESFSITCFAPSSTICLKLS